MAEHYFVGESPESGLIGLLPESEVRLRLAAGSLRPTFVCLPASATGEVAGQWQPLGVVFGTARSDPESGPIPTTLTPPRRPNRWHSPRRSAAAGLLAGGAVIVATGITVRVRARAWAWPDQWWYSGDRANTTWAFNEALYIDLGLAAVAFGIGLILLGIWRFIR